MDETVVDLVVHLVVDLVVDLLMEGLVVDFDVEVEHLGVTVSVLVLIDPGLSSVTYNETMWVSSCQSST